ncbi:MAG: hypothetical protein QXW37_07360 [Candidatus Nitrosotenuis sp.]
MQKAVWIGIAGCIIAVAALSLVSFNMITSIPLPNGYNMGSMSGGMSGMGGGHGMSMSGGMSGMGGGHGMSMSGGMSGMDHSMTSPMQQICKQASGMPPHYCEPTYITMSSVPGIKISKVEPVSDTEVKAIIKEVTNAKVSQKLVFVGGSGYLSGATIIEDGWSKTKIVHLKFDGKGTIYDFTEIHLHLFPYTGE